MTTESVGADSRRRTILAALALLPAAAWAASPQSATTVKVWKSPTCGCCKDWVAHLQSNGFDVTTYEVDDLTAARSKAGMPDRYASCHTAVVEGYALEGHVPAREIRRLLRERPTAVGLAVPGMPLGSPGMDGPEYGGRRTPYDVLLVMGDGRARVFQAYP
ncbi:MULTISPECIES: DUF411 domain-containing protein [Cupriavidus]|uniref:Twin-arginine translocation pathway signal n=1 Tax=Cupriavidus pinatubonensis (strain JMP 134 / LMG 1197) TaxID=264198 RepID=Q46YD7_CUPPJ|nr:MULTISPECIES: DUF411 domain-containing protein [Cupriavidus]QYY30707.1 DUF411 domain-containing protein [Cupriavidus pinatubonensis]